MSERQFQTLSPVKADDEAINARVIFTDRASRRIAETFRQYFGTVGFELELHSISESILGFKVRWTDPLLRISARTWNSSIDVDEFDTDAKVDGFFGTFMKDVSQQLREHREKQGRFLKENNEREKRRRRPG